MDRRPSRFQFLQLVRLLRKRRPDRGPVGRDLDPDEEFVRFRSDLSYGFPTGDVRALESPDEDATAAAGSGADGDRAPHEMTVNFFGVATPNSFGSLPTPYAEAVRGRLRDRHGAPRDFLDLFNHRLVSLFYRAWERSRPDVLLDLGEDSPYERALRAVMGLEGGSLRDRLPFDSRDLLARAGLLAMRPAPAAAIEGLVESFLGIPARVLPFRPGWYEIDRGDRTRLGTRNSTLGADVCLGAEVCLVQWRFRLRVGPMDLDTYRALLPGGAAFDALAETIRLAIGPELDFEVNAVLDREDVPPLRLGGDPTAPTAGRLGWSTWLDRGGVDRDADEAVFAPAPLGAATHGTREMRP